MSGKSGPPRFVAPRPAPLSLGGSEHKDPVYGKGLKGRYTFNLQEFEELEMKRGEVKAVDTDRRVARVRCHGEASDALCGWMVPYAHGEGAHEGVDYAPREGAQVVVARMQGQYIILGCYIASAGAERGGSEGGYVPNHAGFRPPTLEAGDYRIGTIDGNRVELTTDGAVTLYSRAVAQLVIEPLRGLGRFFLRNYQKFVEGGFLKWDSYHEQDGEPRSDMTWMLKDDPRAGKDNQVYIRIGKKGDISEFEVLRRESEESFTSTFLAHVDVDGNVDVRANEDANITVVGDAKVGVGGDCELTVNGNYEADVLGTYTVRAGGNVLIEGKEIDLVSTGV